MSCDFFTVRNGFLERVRGQGESSLLAGKGTGDWLLVTSPCRENSLQISKKKVLQTPCFESNVASKKTQMTCEDDQS